MAAYQVPTLPKPPKAKKNQILLVASGDLRLSANQTCWAAQKEMEDALARVVADAGYQLVRAHPYKEDEKHGFISSQKEGMEVFATIDPKAPLIIAEAVWQFTHHVLSGILSHEGPVLTVANWSGTWPGLVGMLNLNASLTKAGKKYSTLWAEDFADPQFIKNLKKWLDKGEVKHRIDHVTPLKKVKISGAEKKLGHALAEQLRRQKAIMGIFDEGCMGMYNAIIDDELLNPMGVYKERLSQSALVAAMRQVRDDEAQAVRDWLDQRGVTFRTGSDPATELTDDQILEQCKMYIAALRMADAFGCAAIGIQYQQGLKDMAPASDLVEGLLNNPDRPPAYHAATGEELYAGKALPHFNEVDEGAALDALVTNRVWTALGHDPSTTLHDVRWGEHFTGDGVDDYVWVFMISGAAPASHFVGGYGGAISERQPPMFFPFGGGTLKGVGKPGEIVWSRVYVMDGALHVDMGRGHVVTLPEEETERRWRATDYAWPIVHGVVNGVTRDQFMGRHKANHIQIAYAPDAASADRALAAKAAMFEAMGVAVHLCGEVPVG